MLLFDLLEWYIRDEAHLIVMNECGNRLYDFGVDGGDFPPDLMMRYVSRINPIEVDGCLEITVK